MTPEEQRAARHLQSRANRTAYEAQNARRLRGGEAARVGTEKAWDALLPDDLRRWEPRELREARRRGELLGEGDD